MGGDLSSTYCWASSLGLSQHYVYRLPLYLLLDALYNLVSLVFMHLVGVSANLQRNHINRRQRETSPPAQEGIAETAKEDVTASDKRDVIVGSGK